MITIVVPQQLHLSSILLWLVYISLSQSLKASVYARHSLVRLSMGVVVTVFHTSGKGMLERPPLTRHDNGIIEVSQSRSFDQIAMVHDRIFLHGFEGQRR